MAVSSIGIITKKGAPEPRQLAAELADWLRRRGLSVAVDRIPADTDLLVILGGDGTLLHAAGMASQLDIPVVGINLGGLGFLTEVGAGEVYDVLEQILAGRATIRKRMMLQARLSSTAATTGWQTALNEVAISKAHVDRLVSLSTWSDDEYLTTYKADGLIFATPTGSTAYNLSAGGPIVHPGFDSIVVTPICPFMLESRPLLLPPGVRLVTRMAGPAQDVRVIVDGRFAWSMGEEDRLEIQASPRPLQLIGSPSLTYFEILRGKLNWGGRPAAAS
ncbi:MAG: NAD(+)/NADH kinase [Thermodesulfobacteriota bacterium]